MNRTDKKVHVYWYDPYAEGAVAAGGTTAEGFSAEGEGEEGEEGGERGEGRMVGMIFYATLRPNENWCVDTSLGHQWVAYDDDRVELGRWIASRSLPLVVFLPGKKGSRKEEEGERVSDV